MIKWSFAWVLSLALAFVGGAALAQVPAQPLPGQSYLEVAVCPPGVLVNGEVPADRAGCDVDYLERATPECYAIRERDKRTDGFAGTATALGLPGDLNALIGGKIELNCIDGPSIPVVAAIPPIPTELPPDLCERMIVFLAGKGVTPAEPEINALFGEAVCPPDPPPADAGDGVPGG